MELRSLLQVLVSRWWLVVPVFVIAIGASLVVTLSQRPTYEAGTTLIVAPSRTVGEDIINVVSTLSRQTEITETYAQVASSRSIQRTAADALDLSGDQRRDVRIVSRLVTGTTLLSVTARSSNPELASAYANAVGEALVAFVDTNDPIFTVSVLDVASVPESPVEPNVPLNIALGAAAGLLLGAGLAVVLQVLNPPPRTALREVIDTDTWAFNNAFLVYRLRQEMSRARRTRQPVALALMNVNHLGVLNELLPRAQTEALRRIASLVDGHLRPEDVLARLDGSTFAILLPDTTEEQALAMVESLRSRVGMPALGSVAGGKAVHANPAAGVVAYRDGPATDGDLLQHARLALHTAEAGPAGRTEAFSGLSAQRTG